MVNTAGSNHVLNSEFLDFNLQFGSIADFFSIMPRCILTLLLTLRTGNHHLARLEYKCRRSLRLLHPHDHCRKPLRVVLRIPTLLCYLLKIQLLIQLSSRHQVLQYWQLQLRLSIRCIELILLLRRHRWLSPTISLHLISLPGSFPLSHRHRRRHVFHGATWLQTGVGY